MFWGLVGNIERGKSPWQLPLVGWTLGNPGGGSEESCQHNVWQSLPLWSKFSSDGEIGYRVSSFCNVVGVLTHSTDSYECQWVCKRDQSKVSHWGTYGL